MDYHHHHHHHRPLFLLHSSLAVSQKRACINEQALLIHCSAENFMNTQHVLSTAAFCFRLYKQGGGHAISDFSVILGG